MNEDYLGFEVAKLLKEKGYKGSFNGYYNNAGCVVDKPNPLLKEPKYQYYERVSLYMAMKWLRKKHNIHVVLKFDFYAGNYTGRIYDGRRESAAERDDYIAIVGNSTHEQACEETIKYCLENLI